MSLSPLPVSEAEPTEVAHQYWSVDSAPARLTQSLSIWVAPAVLMLFTAVATLLLLAVNSVPALVRLFPQHDFVFSPYEGTHSVPLRIFMLSFYIAFAAVVGASGPARLRFLSELIVTFVLVCGLFDLGNILAFRLFGLVYSLHIVEIISGLLGYFIFSLKLLEHGSMPARAAVPKRQFKRRLSWTPLGLAAVTALGLSVLINGLDLPLIGDLRGVSLLGGIGPGVFLFLPLTFFLLYLLGTLRNLVRPPKPLAPPVTIIIPAHNESHVIARTLKAVDAAAGRYAGAVNILVLNNNSSDDTASIAQGALAGMEHATGRVVDVPMPGKAIALNRGVMATNSSFLVRIDADTQVLPDALQRAMRHFSDARVGVVGGLPLPPGDGPFDRARLLEVLLKHGYYQTAYGAVNGIVGVPGMFAAYRTEAVRAAGGFVQGMNGEDTDVSLRIGEMGYRVVGDPTVQYVSEVPRTYPHMREQRMRWFRSVYHVTARNRDYLDVSTPSIRGKLIVPFMLLNSARRAMNVPLAIFGLLHLTLALDPSSPLTGQAVLAVMLGSPLLMGAFAALANGRPDALVGLPEYVAFRLLRSYLTLESVLSIAFAPSRRPVSAPSGR